MLITASTLLNTPVMSLQTGSELGRTAREIIDPRDLSIVAYELDGPLLDQDPTLLRLEDVREIGPLGMIIDSADELIGVADVIELKKVYEYDFQLLDKPVFDEKGHKIGRVNGYTLMSGNFIIQQLNIRRPLLKSFGDTGMLIHRSQVTKVTDQRIIVKSATVSRKEEEIDTPHLTTYTNPFRKAPKPGSTEPDAA